MKVSATGIPVTWTKARSARRGVAADRAVAGEHDRVLGGVDDLGGALQLAHARARAARARGAGAARHRAARIITSSGSSRWVAPGFSDSATLNALRTTSGTISGLETRAFHLTIGSQDPDQVDVLVRLLVHPLEVGLAGERDERRAIEERVGDRGDEVRGARTERAEAHAGAAGQPPVRVGHVGAALLVADGDELDRGVGQRLVEVERLLAGDAEHVLDALGLEALDEHIGCSALGHASTLSNRIPCVPRGRCSTRGRVCLPCGGCLRRCSPSTRRSSCTARSSRCPIRSRVPTAIP